MTEWVVVGVVGAGTFAMRYSLIALFGRIEVPDWLARALRFVAPAVLAALVLPAVAAPGGGAVPSLNPRLVAAVLGGLVAWRTRNVGATILVGLPALWILEALGWTV